MSDTTGLGTKPHDDAKQTSLCSASGVTKKMTLLTFAADCRADVDMVCKAATPAAHSPCSNRSIQPACGANSSKRTAAAVQDGTDKRTDRQTDGHNIVTLTLPHTQHYVSSVKNEHIT